MAEQAGLTAGFISQLERDLTSASLSSFYRICAVLGIRVGNLVDDVPSGQLIRREQQTRRSLAMGNAEHLLLTSREERASTSPSRTSHRAEARATSSYTLPADVELVYVLRGSLELRVGDETHLLEKATRSPARRATRTHGASRPIGRGRRALDGAAEPLRGVALEERQRARPGVVRGRGELLVLRSKKLCGAPS